MTTGVLVRKDDFARAWGGRDPWEMDWPEQYLRNSVDGLDPSPQTACPLKASSAVSFD